MIQVMNDTEMKKLYGIITKSLSTKITSSLSMMLGETFNYDLRRLIKIEFNRIDTIVEPFVQQRMCAVYLKAEGDVRIGMLFFLPENEAKVLAARLLGKTELESIDFMGRSSLSEIGNILLAGSFINSISESTGFQIDCSAPGFALENIKAILGEPIAEIAVTTDHLIIADAQLSSAKGIKINILIVLGIDDALKLLSTNKGINA